MHATNHAHDMMGGLVMGIEVRGPDVTERPAMQQVGNGETYDFEFVPTIAGALRLTVTSAANDQLAVLPIRVSG